MVSLALAFYQILLAVLAAAAELAADFDLNLSLDF